MNRSSAPESTDKRVAPMSRAYVVFDRTTGEVLHVHYSVTVAHGAPSSEAPEARARRFAGNKAGKNAEVVEVEPAEVNHRRPIRIDPASRRLAVRPPGRHP